MSDEETDPGQIGAYHAHVYYGPETKPVAEWVREGLARLPDGRTPTKADWSRLSRSWRGRLDEQINALVALRDGLDSCIGCGCLSLKRCLLYNPQDRVAEDGAGARLLPPLLRRTPAEGR